MVGVGVVARVVDVGAVARAVARGLARAVVRGLARVVARVGVVAVSVRTMVKTILVQTSKDPPGNQRRKNGKGSISTIIS